MGACVEFSRSFRQAAALFVRHKAERHDAILLGWFRRYLLKHYRSWHAFMQQCGFGNEASDIILVTGHDLTEEWATAVIYDREVRSGAQIEAGNIIPSIASASAGLRATSSTSVRLPIRKGPNRRSQPQPQHMAIMPAQDSAEDQTAPQTRNQCIFIRGLRVIERKPWRPRKIEAAAGEEDLGGDRDSDPPGCVVPADYDSDERIGT